MCPFEASVQLVLLHTRPAAKLKGRATVSLAQLIDSSILLLVLCFYGVNCTCRRAWDCCSLNMCHCRGTVPSDSNPVCAPDKHTSV